jgi:hypothetical protein
MIHEYALDPEVLSNWASFRYFVDQFGIPHGRLISRFPKEWKRLVYDASANAAPIEKLRITEGLRSIDRKMIVTGRTYDRSKSWLPNAIISHAQTPFRLIISTDAHVARENVTAATTINATTPGWIVDVNPVARRSADMAAAAETLLKSGNEVLFIDPHFSCGPRHLRPLEAFLAAAAVHQGGRRLEYHLKDTGTRRMVRKQVDAVFAAPKASWNTPANLRPLAGNSGTRNVTRPVYPN